MTFLANLCKNSIKHAASSRSPCRSGFNVKWIWAGIRVAHTKLLRPACEPVVMVRAMYRGPGRALEPSLCSPVLAGRGQARQCPQFAQSRRAGHTDDITRPGPGAWHSRVPTVILSSLETQEWDQWERSQWRVLESVLGKCCDLLPWPDLVSPGICSPVPISALSCLFPTPSHDKNSNPVREVLQSSWCLTFRPSRAQIFSSNLIVH